MEIAGQDLIPLDTQAMRQSLGPGYRAGWWVLIGPDLSRYNLFEFLLTPVIFFDLNDVGRTLDSQKYDAGRALFKERTYVVPLVHQ